MPKQTNFIMALELSFWSYNFLGVICASWDLWKHLRSVLNNNNQQTTLQMKGSSSSSALKAPVFDGENYDFWRIRMTTIFKSYDIWDMVQYRYKLLEMEVDALEKNLTKNTTQNTEVEPDGGC